MKHLSRYTNFTLQFSLILLSLVATNSYAAQGSQDEITFAEAEKYTVKIRTQINYPFYDDAKTSSIGTGFLINREKGLILTNAHVVGRSRSIVKVMFKSNKYYKAKKLYVDFI